MAVVIVNLGTVVPTPSGIVSSKFRDGDDGAGAGPSAPEIGPLVAVNSTTVDIPVTSSGSGGTAPIHWELERSATSSIAGFAVIDAAADFTADGVITDATASASTAYWYRLARVDNAARRSAYSTVRTVTTPAAGGAAPGAPTITSLVSNNPGEITVSFTAGTGTTTSYDILKGEGDGNGAAVGSGSIIASDVTTSPYTTVVSVPASGEIYVRIRGLNGAIAGSYSARSFVDPQTSAEFSGVVKSDFEADAVDSLVYQVDANWGIVGASDGSDSDAGYVRSGSSLARSGSRYMESTIDRDEAGGGTNERNEIRWNTPTTFPTTLTSTAAGNIYVMTADAWIGFSVFVPATWKVLWKRSGGAPLFSEAAKRLPIITQLHHNKVSGDTEGNPPISIGIGANNPTSADALPMWGYSISKNDSTPPTLSGNTSDQVTTVGLIKLGEWTDFVIRLRYHPFTGYCYIYKKDSGDSDFVLQASRTGGVGYAKATNSPYWKIGGYYSLWNVLSYPNRLTVDKDNNEVRSIQLRFDETRYYAGDDGSIAHVRPR